VTSDSRPDSLSLARSLEGIEAEAWRRHQLAAPTPIRERYGIEVRDFAGGVALIAATGPVGMNRVLGLGLDRPLDDETLDGVIDIYRSAGVPRFLLLLSPSALGFDAAELLRRGFTQPSRLAKLFRRPDSVPPTLTDLEVSMIGQSDADLYGRVVAAGHDDPPDLAAAHAATVGMPQWRHYLAYDRDGMAVAGATLFWSDGVAWCGFSSTLATDRGRGAHSALLSRRVRDAAELDCVLVVCETAEETESRPNAAYRNMRRAGFEVAYMRPTLVYAGP
jgi:hypothetical protein